MDVWVSCGCADSYLCRRILSNGAVAWVYQCRDCGREVRKVKAASLEVRSLTEIVPWDETIAERRRATWEQRRQSAEQQRAVEAAAWWERYNTYLQSPQWRARRRAVLERDDYLCQACRRNEAAQVHHLTYAHVGNEPLFELVAVCESCHTALHDEQTRPITAVGALA